MPITTLSPPTTSGSTAPASTLFRMGKAESAFRTVRTQTRSASQAPSNTSLSRQWRFGNLDRRFDQTLIWPKNKIGVAADGSSPIGNQGDGVHLSNTISTTVGADVIANNLNSGVSLSGATSTATIFPDYVGHNGKLPVDLGTTALPQRSGDADSGPNNLLNYPLITL